MRRAVFLFLCVWAVFAQLDDARNGDGLYGAGSTVENISSDIAPAEPETLTDDSFLDDLIGDQPIVPSPPPAQEPAYRAAQPPAEPEPEAESSPPQPASLPVTPPSPASSTGGRTAGKPSAAATDVRVSSTPDFDEAAIQETPDIPQFSHQAHIKDVGAECVQCHQTLFSESVRGYKSGPSMREICSQCHNGTDAPAEVLVGFSNEKKYVKTHMPLFSHTTHLEHTEECTSCHRDIYGAVKKIKIPPPMKICTECHNNGKASSSCRVCHEKPADLQPRSHTARWVYRNGHGLDARYNQSECYDCHTDRECSQCHRGQGPFNVHRPAYKYSHGMDARQRQVNCSYCHDLEHSCAQCHMRTR